jgi:signal transduction histidine kinase
MTGSEDLATYRRAGIRAVQTTPLVSRRGAILGMLSTHWREPHEPSGRDLRLLDVLARQAADLIERSQVEDALRASEARQAFLLRLSDALRPLAEAADIQSTACRIVGEYLKTDRTYYVELDYVRDIAVVAQDYVRGDAPSLAGTHPMAAFSATLGEMRAGRPFVGEDAATDPRIRDVDRPAYVELAIRAWVSVPLIKGGELAAAMCVTNGAHRAWSHQQVALIEEVAERTWSAVERARAEAALREAKSVAEAANRAKSDFLAAMSHEFRTPLNAIAGHAQLLEMGLHGEVNAAQREALARIQRSEANLLALVNDVLNFAKLEAGRLEYDIQDVPLADVVADAFAVIEPQLAAKGIAYQVAIESGVTARADREKLGQILLNLFSNAVKFTGAGGIVVVDLGERDGSPPGFILLRVTDTGIGIPREKQEAVFDPFVQVHRKLTHTTEGTGLGLAISRDLARGMGGNLRVRSRMGEGSTFTLALPRALLRG